jgi:SAM-dependent methyltransferase
VKGAVDVVERSPTFVIRIQHMSRKDGHGLGHVWACDLIDARLPAERYDLIFARWVFLFLPDPLAHVRKLARALKPGGILAIEDYHRETMCLVPRPDDWWEFIEADLAFFGTQGGDASVGSRLPEMYRRAGLDVAPTEVTIKTGRPGSAVWKWITTYFMGVMDRLPKAHGPFTKPKAARLRRQWRAAAKTRTSLLIAPAVLDVVGRKPG